MPKIRTSSIKLFFSIIVWFFGILAITENHFWSAILIHTSSCCYLFFLFFFIKQNKTDSITEKISFWKKPSPSFSHLFSVKTIRKQLLFMGTPLIIWSNSWPYDRALSIHDWDKIEKKAIILLEESEQISDPILKELKTQWNDSITTRTYALTTASDKGTLILTVNKLDSLTNLNYQIKE